MDMILALCSSYHIPYLWVTSSAHGAPALTSVLMIHKFLFPSNLTSHFTSLTSPLAGLGTTLHRQWLKPNFFFPPEPSPFPSFYSPLSPQFPSLWATILGLFLTLWPPSSIDVAPFQSIPNAAANLARRFDQIIHLFESLIGFPSDIISYLSSFCSHLQSSG